MRKIKLFFKRLWAWLFGSDDTKSAVVGIIKGFKYYGILSLTAGKRHLWLSTSEGKIRKPISSELLTLPWLNKRVFGMDLAEAGSSDESVIVSGYTTPEGTTVIDKVDRLGRS